MIETNFVADSGKNVIIITHLFDAPRELIFQTLTDPHLIPQWWGPKKLTTTVDSMDVRKGGIWRFIQRDAEGREYAFNGVYHEVSSPQRLVYTFEFEGMPGHVILEMVTFDAVDGRTKMTDTIVFRSVEDRDGMLRAGMEEGA
ncbi:MAG: SRPBCC family protein, partial [Syntrophales bacterium]|nr:SRPBCC family protein [Syntrophales bacterium]